MRGSECSSDLDGQKDFLNDLNIPKLSEEESKTLNEGITKQETADAIGSMQAGKTAGLDGIPIDLYKTFQSTDTLIGDVSGILQEGSPFDIHEGCPNYTASETGKTKYKMSKYAAN